MGNNIGKAVSAPTTLDAKIHTAITTACSRFMQGTIKEHKAYSFYNGCTIKFFTTEAFTRVLDNLSHEDNAGSFGIPYIIDGVKIGEWTLTPKNGKWNEMIILHLEDRYYDKPWLIVDLARIAPFGFIRNETTVRYCRGNDGKMHCGLPLGYQDLKVDSCCQCYRCWGIEDKVNPVSLDF